MSLLRSIVEDSDAACKAEAPATEPGGSRPRRSSDVERSIHEHVRSILEFLKEPDPSRSFDVVERGLVPRLFALGQLFLAFFLAWRHERSNSAVRAWTRRGLRRRQAQPRTIKTFFGPVRYWRTYMTDDAGSGLYPLDLALGMTADSFSLLVVDIAARLPTVVSYDQATAIFELFVGWAPSNTAVEQMVLGLGQRTQNWFRDAPPQRSSVSVRLRHGLPVDGGLVARR